MLDIRKVRHFVQLCDSANFQKAADALHLSQPALTRSIQSLEKQYGVRLIERGRAGAQPSEVGRQFLDSAKALLHNSTAVERTLIEFAQGISGQVRFSVGSSTAQGVLPLAVARISSEYPGITLSASLDPTEAMVKKLRASEVEFAIGRRLIGRESDDSLNAAPLGLARPVFQVRPEHPLLGTTKPITAQQLLEFPRIGGGGWWRYVVSSPLEESTTPLDATLEVENFGILAAVALGCDAILLASQPLNPGLVHLEVADVKLEPSEVVLLTAKDRMLSPAAKAVARIASQYTRQVLAT